MRSGAIRKALLEAEPHPAVIHLNDGSRLKVPSREHWMAGPEYLYVMQGRDLHYISYRNVTGVEVRTARRRRRTQKAR